MDSKSEPAYPQIMKNGLHILYSPVNQAYFLMWFDHILCIKNEKWEAQAEMDDLLRGTEHA